MVCQPKFGLGTAGPVTARRLSSVEARFALERYVQFC